jgi:short-subunit dehydrogenase
MAISNQHDTTVFITGATGAIGYALAEFYAKPGTHLLLHGRRELRLQVISTRCTALGATVTLIVLDLQDTDALLSCIQTQLIPNLPDVLIANAGININIKPDRSGEDTQDMLALLDINIKSTLLLVNGLLPAMQARGSGQIALMSSLAGYYGLPITPSYSASKAAIKAYGEALRGLLEPDGIKVNVIMPGYVTSTMADAMPGPKPFLWSPAKAARYIAHGLARNQARISFPFPLNFGTWWLAVLPAAVSQRILRLLNYGG